MLLLVGMFAQERVEQFEDFYNWIFDVIYPDWLRSTEESIKFRGFVLDKHAIIEHLLDLLIVARFFGTVFSDRADEFRYAVLMDMPFSKKLDILLKTAVLDGKFLKKVRKVNDYRKAQAHLKIGSPFRDSNPENFEDFSKVSTEVTSVLVKTLMRVDDAMLARLRKRLDELEGEGHDISKLAEYI